jgi:PKHD-type hydroxylase
MLLHIPAVLTAHEVREVRAVLDAAEWEDGRVTAGHRAQGVKNNRQLAVGAPEARRLGEMVTDRLGRHPRFAAAVLPLRVLPPRFNRYEGEESYGLHVDNAVFPVPGTSLSVRSDVSTTVFLSDPDEYDGGELIIEDTFGEQRVKLPAGDAIVYAGSSLHRVARVTRGVRFASFLWTQSLVRSDAKRRMLYELDVAIQDLGADHPEHGAIDSLVNLYHNLLREWAVT